MTTEFQWNDELVKEFITETFFSATNAYMYPEKVEQFKASKQPKPEWEILRYKDNAGRIFESYQAIQRKIIDSKIYSVKRLSDGEVFTVDDKFTANAGCELTIKSFEVDGNSLRVYTIEYGYWMLSELVKQKPILFTTEDGAALKEGDNIWVVTKLTFFLGQHKCTLDFLSNHKGAENDFAYFSTKEAAKEYILMNKPLFSISEIIELGGIKAGDPGYDIYIPKFIDKAKAKLQ